MRAAPVRLKHYHLTRISIEPNEAYEIDSVNQKDPYPEFRHANFQIGVHVARDANDKNIHLVAVELKAEPKTGEQFPYKFQIGAEGIVSCHDESDEATVRKLSAVNGCSLLYSALRDTLLSLSLRLPNGPVLLPSANFNDLKDDLALEKAKREAPTPPVIADVESKPARARRTKKTT